MIIDSEVKEYIKETVKHLSPEERNRLAVQLFEGVCISCGEETPDDKVQCQKCWENRLYMIYFGRSGE